MTWHDGAALAHRRVRLGARRTSRRGCSSSCSARTPGDRPRAPSSRSTCCSTGCPGCAPGVAPRAAFAGHLARRRGLQPAPAGLRRGGRGRDARRRQPGELYCHSPHRPVDPRAAGGQGEAHADLLRRAHPGAGCSPSNVEAQRDDAVAARPRRDQRAPRGADRVAARRWTGTATRAWRPRPRRTSTRRWRCPAATSSTATCPGRGPRTGPAWTPRRSAGASRPTCPTCCSAARAPAAAGRSAASAGTTPRRPCWRRRAGDRRSPGSRTGGQTAARVHLHDRVGRWAAPSRRPARR